MRIKLTDSPGSGEPVTVEIKQPKGQKRKRSIAAAARSTADPDARIAALATMLLAGLQGEYQSLFGVEPVTKNVKALRGMITRKIRRIEIDAGRTAAPEATKAKGKADRQPEAPSPAPAPAAPSAGRDPRLPVPGETLTREHNGAKVVVRVLDDGFEWGGKQYRSLSAVAMAITGAKAINGYLFFQLGKYAKTSQS